MFERKHNPSFKHFEKELFNGILKEKAIFHKENHKFSTEVPFFSLMIANTGKRCNYYRGCFLLESPPYEIPLPTIPLVDLIVNLLSIY